MSNFQNIVVGVSIILLIICLIVIGYSLYNKSSKDAFPPVVEDCPDYWLDKSNGDSSNCVNVKNLGTMTEQCSGPMDFSSEEWQGASGLDRKQSWAKHCELQWDGVTNTDLPRDSSNNDDEDDETNGDLLSKCSKCPPEDEEEDEEETGETENEEDESYDESLFSTMDGEAVHFDVGNKTVHGSNIEAFRSLSDLAQSAASIN